MKEPRGKNARWIEILSHYDSAIEHKSRKKQGHCDALSRCNNPKDCDCPLQDMDEDLKCCPCKKCVKRANDMQHVGLIDKNKWTEKDDSRTDNQLLRAVSEPLPGPSGITDNKGKQSEHNQHEWSWANGQSKKQSRGSSPNFQPYHLSCKQKYRTASSVQALWQNSALLHAIIGSYGMS